MHLLVHGGMLPRYQPAEGEQKVSPRKRGVKQGAVIFLLGFLLVPVLAVFTNFAPGRLSIMFEFFLILSALLCFVGGPLRMLIAAIFEEGAAASQFVAQSSYVPAMPPAPARVTALPPASATPTSAWRPRPQTAEVAPPPSVTDHTTQLLNKSEPETE